VVAVASNNRSKRTTEAFRTKLWPVPMIAVALAIAAGVAMPPVDRGLADVIPAVLRGYLFGGGPAQASEMLGTVAGSLITVTSLTFSLTVVTLQLASGQYSPRLMRTFSRDRFVQVTLALFLATFAYALVVLRTVRVREGEVEAFVPHVSVTLAYLLALASVIALVLFLAHLVKEIRVETLVATVRADAAAAGSQMFKEKDSSDSLDSIPPVPAHACLITARSDGFLVGIDENALLSAAKDRDAVIAVDRMPGDWIVEGTPVAHAWRADAGARFGEDDLGTLADGVTSALQTAHERTPVQDIAYGLRQLTDVAVKALSPGINDPTTAVHALVHSRTLLCDLADLRLGTAVLRSDDDAVRVVIRRPDLADLLDLAMVQPRLYGAEDPLVLDALFALLRDLAWRVDKPEHRAAVAEQLEGLRRTITEQSFDPGNRERLAKAGLAVEAALTKSWL
jgi:uncharacterized membrane protein